MKYVLQVQGQDRKGLISEISSILFDHGFNIDEMKEHVEKENNLFFMRCEFSGESGISDLRTVLEKKLHDSKVSVHTSEKKDIVVFATKEHHCLADLLVRNHYGEMNANIKCVIANHNDLRDITERFGITFHHVSHLEKSKAEFEAELVKVAKSYNPDYLVLAKFLRILSPDFVAQFPEKIVNIHHSFLPAFIGANPYRQAFDRGIKIIGATAHFVTNDLDEGPIISQKTITVDHSYTADDMKKAGKETERLALAEALELVFEDRVFVSENKTIIFE